MAYRIENLDVYRKTVALGVRLYKAAEDGAGNGAAPVAARMRDNALALVLHMADGLAFWERGRKEEHFEAAKRAVVEMTPLLELMVSCGGMKAEEEARFSDDLQDLQKMVGGLLRQARTRGQQADEAPRGAESEAREPRVKFN